MEMTREEILKVAKPILFNAEEVRAILDDRKTVTRQAIKVRFRKEEYGYNIIRNAHTGEFCYLEVYDEWESEVRRIGYPYKPGDYLYVKETWAFLDAEMCGCMCWGPCNTYKDRFGCFVYRANQKYGFIWEPSIHMPKEAARIFLRVTDVRVERLQEITGRECVKEGIPESSLLEMGDDFTIGQFHDLWDSTIKPKDRDKYGWDENPYVWKIEFEKVEVD